VILSSYINSNNWFTWFYSDTLTEFVNFFSRLLCEKTPTGLRQQVEKDDMIGYVHKRRDGLTAVLVTDVDYPVRVAFDLVRKALYDFDDYVQQNQIRNQQLMSGDNSVSAYNNTLKELVLKYQDPTKADSMLKLKKDLEETKEVLHQGIEKLLERGESIDSLIERTNEISESGKEFYRRTKRSKCPCNIL
jgi:synaptobrevin family protein YKT6